MRIAKWLAIFAASTILLLGAAGYAFLQGWHIPRVTPGELESLLAPGYEYLRPDGPGPFPTVVQFHGCGGLFENQRVWAREFQAAGWASVIVDSNGPRGLSWQDVCRGRALHGGERAGDVLVSLAHVRALPYVDPDRIVLAGWSHGGWSIMDLLAMDPPRELPHNLAEVPPGGLSGIAGLLFVYPYCGFGTRSAPWKQALPSLFVFAGADTVAQVHKCLDLVKRLRDLDHPIDVFTLDGVNHAFDEQGHRPGDVLVYDPDATEQALARSVAFLATIGNTR